MLQQALTLRLSKKMAECGALSYDFLQSASDKNVSPIMFLKEWMKDIEGAL